MWPEAKQISCYDHEIDLYMDVLMMQHICGIAYVIAATESFSDLPLFFFLKKTLVIVMVHVFCVPSCGFTVAINDKMINQIIVYAKSDSQIWQYDNQRTF